MALADLKPSSKLQRGLGIEGNRRNEAMQKYVLTDQIVTAAS